MSHRPTVTDIKSNLMKHRKQACQLDPRSVVVPFSKALSAVNNAIAAKQREINKLTKQLQYEQQRATNTTAHPGNQILGEQVQQ